MTMTKALYLGLDSSHYISEKTIIHCPLIEIVPKPYQDPSLIKAFQHILQHTHFIFTSKTAVHLFFNFCTLFGYTSNQVDNKTYLAVGKITSQALQSFGVSSPLVADTETAEGILNLLSQIDLKNASIFWPHSALSRPLIRDYLTVQSISFSECIIYDTLTKKPNPLPNWNEFNEIIFTSPSTITAFLSIFGKIPLQKQLTSIGPITANKLWSCVISQLSTK
jgi:uroporphyrinogen-III synthase